MEFMGGATVQQDTQNMESPLRVYLYPRSETLILNAINSYLLSFNTSQKSHKTIVFSLKNKYNYPLTNKDKSTYIVQEKVEYKFKGKSDLEVLIRFYVFSMQF